MKWQKWLEKWEMASLKINTPFLEMEWSPKNADRDAAWALYIELLTRIATQPLRAEDGEEQSALDSIHALFPLTRQIIRENGRDCVEFTKIAVVVLNQVVRPFTSKWHRLLHDGAFRKSAQRKRFRSELSALQGELRKYAKMLAHMAAVEDLTGLDPSSGAP